MDDIFRAMAGKDRSSPAKNFTLTLIFPKMGKEECCGRKPRQWPFAVRLRVCNPSSRSFLSTISTSERE
jgi:hypothetical protein